MNKWRIAELVLLAASSLITAAKAVVKFVGYVGKLMSKPRACFC